MSNSSLVEVKKICIEQLLIPFEGYAKALPNGDCTAYPDPATGGDPWTIGYGSTYDDKGVKVKKGDVWTHKKALDVKSKVVDDFLSELIKSSPKLVLEPPMRIAAILSWVYNLGIANYNKSTFKKMIDIGDWRQASEECKKWNKANGKVLNGLTKRRNLEAMFILMT